MASIDCGIRRRLEVLILIKDNVTNATSLTDEIKSSSETMIKSINSTLKRLATNMISLAIKNNQFQKDTDAHRAAVAIYKFDEELFNQVMVALFKQIAEDDNFRSIVDSLNSFEDNELKAEAFCKLDPFIWNFSENLWKFECTVNHLLKVENIQPKEKQKLEKLLNNIKDHSAKFLQAAAITSQFEYDY